MYKQPVSTLTAISAGTIFKSLKYSIVLDRFIKRKQILKMSIIMSVWQLKTSTDH